MTYCYLYVVCLVLEPKLGLGPQLTLLVLLLFQAGSVCLVALEAVG